MLCFSFWRPVPPHVDAGYSVFLEHVQLRQCVKILVIPENNFMSQMAGNKVTQVHENITVMRNYVMHGYNLPALRAGAH